MASSLPKKIKQQLENTRVVGIIGCSQNKYRTSHHIAEYLQEQEKRIIPINPNYDKVLGEQCYDHIMDLPADIELEIVDIFRNSAHTAEAVNDIVKYARKTDQKPLIWTQLDVSSEKAKSAAKEAGLPYVENKCIMVEHRKLQ